jgi:pimeloyl-ACP methyl ester carboxylesterase
MMELPLPAGVTRRLVATSRGPVQVLCGEPEDGEDIPDVVMASGFFGTKEDFRELLALLAVAGLRGWAYDYRGQLDPDAAEQDFSIDALALDMRDVMHAVGAGRPVHVIGHCLGGFVARAAVLAEPGLALSLSLLACGPSMLDSKHQAMLSGLARIHTNGGTIALWPLVRRLLADDDVVMREFWQAKLGSMNPSWVTGVAESMAEEPDRTAEIAAAGLPALVVHGKRDRRLWSHAAYAEFAGRLRAECVVIDRASHSPNMEQPGPTAAALRAFWSDGGAAPRRTAAVAG